MIVEMELAKCETCSNYDQVEILVNDENETIRVCGSCKHNFYNGEM